MMNAHYIHFVSLLSEDELQAKSFGRVPKNSGSYFKNAERKRENLQR